MNKRVTLDLGSINVASFETGRENGTAKEGLFATKHTDDGCCVDTICVTRIECSSSRCTG